RRPAPPEVRRSHARGQPGGLAPGWASAARSRLAHVAAHQAPSALEPPASVAEAVSSLTIVDAFTAAGESPAAAAPAFPRRFICSFPDCSASYNKAWKLDAHLCKHTGEVTRPQRGVAARPRDEGRSAWRQRVGAQGRLCRMCSALAPWPAEANQLCLRLGKEHEQVDQKF
uniref:General transcription factor IIIA n=1 Tax=Equus asinus TaxID=9793 RepID=A0A9L0INB7_EQUAS